MCDHGLGHELRAEFWPWTFDFLLDHPRGIYPSPYAAGLPDSFPGYCTLPESDLERIENLEQLRWLENGGRIQALEIRKAPPGIDTEQEYLQFVTRWRKQVGK
jgi:CMP-2-keto-3-deoxyoctulosonic acid synthetase